VKSVVVNTSASTVLSSAKDWLEARDAEGFNLILISTGRADLAVAGDIVSSFGLYVHNKETREPVKLLTDAPAVRIVDIATLVKKHPAKLATFLGAVLDAHNSRPQKPPSVFRWCADGDDDEGEGDASFRPSYATYRAALCFLFTGEVPTRAPSIRHNRRLIFIYRLYSFTSLTSPERRTSQDLKDLKDLKDNASVAGSEALSEVL